MYAAAEPKRSVEVSAKWSLTLAELGFVQRGRWKSTILRVAAKAQGGIPLRNPLPLTKESVL
jgi:hypothetical protein